MKNKVLTRRQFNLLVASTASLVAIAPAAKVEALTATSTRKRRRRTNFQPAIAAFAIGSIPLNGVF
jgi:hypothetical protein